MGSRGMVDGRATRARASSARAGGVLVCEDDDCGSSIDVTPEGAVPALVVEASRRFGDRCRLSFVCLGCLVRTDVDGDLARALGLHADCMTRRRA